MGHPRLKDAYERPLMGDLLVHRHRERYGLVVGFTPDGRPRIRCGGKTRPSLLTSLRNNWRLVTDDERAKAERAVGLRKAEPKQQQLAPVPGVGVETLADLVAVLRELVDEIGHLRREVKVAAVVQDRPTNGAEAQL